MNYSKINIYYDCYIPKRDLQNNIIQVYIIRIIIQSTRHNWCPVKIDLVK